jgi:methylene-fatty-acyl-phospholipid synthase
MSLWVWLVVAALLSLERMCYVWIARAPDSFRAFCTRPVVAYFGAPVEKLCYGFKGIQLTIFFGWCYLSGNRSPTPLCESVFALGVGGALLVAGQMLNISVFYRLGKIGVFYGKQLGYEIPWCQALPFSLLRHPQYVGTVLSIWGFFLAIRFPHNDWYLLPTLETVYYVLGAYFEQMD